MKEFMVLYNKTTSFFRDIFIYIVPGTILIADILLLLLLENNNNKVSNGIDFVSTIENIKKLFFWVATFYFIVAYVCGFILSQFFHLITCLFNWCKTEKIKALEIQMKKMIPPQIKHESNENHVYIEMMVYKDKPDLHNVFIERYNVLYRFAGNLAFCSLFIAMINLVVYCRLEYDYIYNNANITSIVIAFLFFIIFLFSQYRLKIAFYHRLLTCYKINIINHEK